jgi:tetraacyldisaccharide 4'-kinase
MRARLEKLLTDCWYNGVNRAFVFVMLPLSWLFGALVFVRRQAYQLGLINRHRLPVPIIVVGNLTVGGTGKTPLVIWLVRFLKQQGYNPCVLSRGYRGTASKWPQQVRKDSDPRSVGDEAILLAEHCQCPLGVSPDRVAAGNALLEHEQCDIIVCDDGLQHYALARDIEILVVDGVRRFGNGFMLPAGPLREPVSRLESVDIVVANGTPGRKEFGMRIVADDLHNVHDWTQRVDAEYFSGKKVHAVTGIGNPSRFFYTLKKLGMEVIEHAFPDHHDFTVDDLEFADNLPIIMTEKDAVKCRRLAKDNCWYLVIRVEMPENFQHRLLRILDEVQVDG